MIKRICLLLMFSIALCGCATMRTHQTMIKESNVWDYHKALDSWVGHSPTDLVASWGQPDEIVTLVGGDKVFVYDSQATPTTFEVDSAKEEVTAWTYKGKF